MGHVRTRMTGKRSSPSVQEAPASALAGRWQRKMFCSQSSHPYFAFVLLLSPSQECSLQRGYTVGISLFPSAAQVRSHSCCLGSNRHRERLGVKRRAARFAATGPCACKAVPRRGKGKGSICDAVVCLKARHKGQNSTLFTFSPQIFGNKRCTTGNSQEAKPRPASPLPPQGGLHPSVPKLLLDLISCLGRGSSFPLWVAVTAKDATAASASQMKPLKTPVFCYCKTRVFLLLHQHDFLSGTGYLTEPREGFWPQ